MNGSLSSSQRKYLRGLAHGLKPVVHIGRGGASDSATAMVDRTLEDHELIKIRFTDGGADKEVVCAELCDALSCQLAGIIGHVAILYRAAGDEDRRRIRIPDGPASAGEG